jgi:bifunctional non-homologous end joining protein LigD
LKQLSVTSAVIDGEIVAVDPKGRPSFQLLQNIQRASRGNSRPPLFYYAFDLLNVDGRDTRQLPLRERKALLQTLVQPVGDPIRFSASLEGDPRRLLAQVKRHGLEGIIAKDPESTYEAGHRSSRWLKIKTGQRQEFVIGGYTPPEGARKYFGAIAVGYFQRGQLRYASKVGTGFDSTNLEELYRQFRSLESSRYPFVDLPASARGQFHWLKPQLVCEVKFAEWTHDGRLRQPVFLGLRTDKKPSEIVREKPERVGKR